MDNLKNVKKEIEYYETTIVPEMLQARNAGMSYDDTAYYLNGKRLYLPNGKRWQIHSVYRFIQANPDIFCGYSDTKE